MVCSSLFDDSRIIYLQQKRVIEHRVRLEVTSDSIPRSVASRQSVYFIKHEASPVPEPSNVAEQEAVFSNALEFGLLNGRNLVMLEQIISRIYLPLLSSERASDQQGQLAASDDFLVNLRKFASHMRRTIQQVEGDVKLKLPDIPLEQLQDTAACVSNPSTVIEAEKNVEAWSITIAAVIESQLKRAPVGPGPLAEIDYWVERSSTLTALYEQLEIPAVKAIIAILVRASATPLTTFELRRRDLVRLHTEAKDNVKFLSTLERHFKNLTATADFNVAIEIIPSMMNALRMVWIISRHYNTDQRMVPLMERIAWLIADKVARRIDAKTVLKCVH
jgi:dynein heavy chain